MNRRSNRNPLGIAALAVAAAVSAKAARALADSYGSRPAARNRNADSSSKAQASGRPVVTETKGNRRPAQNAATPAVVETKLPPRFMRRRMRWAGGLAILVLMAGVAVAMASTGGSQVRPSHTLADRGAGATTTTAVGHDTGAVKTVRDSEEDQSFPEPDTAKPHRYARMPVASGTTSPSPGIPSDAELRKELRKQDRDAKIAKHDGVTLLPDGSAEASFDAPPEVQSVIAAANEITNFPYRWGGGHGSFVDNAYDCSGSLSYALAAAGLVDKPLVSGELAGWGAAGPGKWITVYAHGGHTFMLVGGLRYDTSGRDGPRGSRWQKAPRSLKGFQVRHWPGL